jgi:outer membrane lipoprotein-sorting protein
MTPFLKTTIALCFIFLTGTLSCASRQAARPTTPASYETAQQILRQWMKTQQEYRSLSGFVQVSVEARGRRNSFDAAILLKAPDKLSIHILDDLGQERFRLIADGKEVLWFEHGDETYSHSPQEGDALQKALHLPLSIEEFIDRLLTHVPQGEVLQLAMGEASPDPVFEITRQGDHLSMLDDPPRLRGFQAFAEGRGKKKRYEVNYGDFENHDGLPFPKSVRWTFRRPRARVEMYFRDVQLNPSLSEEKFTISID